MRIINFTEQTYNDIWSECIDYANCEDDAFLKSCYLGEAKSIESKTDMTLSQKWVALLMTGLFHDAVGKVLEINSHRAIVTTDY